MPPQIKQDLNRSGWETTDFPSVCESCLPENPYVQMIKANYNEECKICTRPFTVFRWKADRASRTKRTNICLTCARLKNCCQCCMLDLSFGLPIVVRDAALKMVAPGPESSINREYYAQNNERELEEGRGGLEAYEKTDEKARELLRRLANSEPYHRKQRRLEAEAAAAEEEEGGSSSGQKRIEGATGPGPMRTHDHKSPESTPYTRPSSSARGGRGSARGNRHSGVGLPRPEDIEPPRDPNVTSLFVTGVEDDLPEHMIRKHFAAFGPLRSIVCSHRAHSAFINYTSRAAAETAAAACQGKAVIAGVPLKVRWGKPRPLDSMDENERMMHARHGRDTASAIKAAASGPGSKAKAVATDPARRAEELEATLAPPPGQEDVQYASLAGD